MLYKAKTPAEASPRASKSFAQVLQPKSNPFTSLAQDVIDADREYRIDRLRLELLAKLSTNERHSIWNRLKSEITARSPEQIRRLEIERGLSREPDPQPHQKISIAKFSRPNNSLDGRSVTEGEEGQWLEFDR